MVLCEEQHTPDSKACRHFTPNHSLPVEMEQMRLFAQTFPAEQRAVLKWALEQADIIVGQRDGNGNQLALGDVVGFRFGDTEYTGIVDGVDHKTQSLNVFCPAFPKANILLNRTSVTKKNVVPEAFGEMADYEEGTAEWHLECLADQIINLRNLSAEEDTPKKFKELLEYQRRWNETDARLRFSVALKAAR